MSTVRSSLSLLSRLSLLRGYMGKGKIRKVESQQGGKVRKGEKPGNRNSQETGESKDSQETVKIRHRGKSGNTKSQETGQVRKRFCMLQPNARHTANGNSQERGKVRNRGKSGDGKATNLTFPTFPAFS